VRLSRINGMELDSTQSLPSNIRRVTSGEENSQRTTFGRMENIQANFISIVTEGVTGYGSKEGLVVGTC
jgi:hypothetical protein